MAFDFFKFLDERSKSLPITDDDISNFNNYMCQKVLSMNPIFLNISNGINTPKFFALPKEIQCKAYTSLNGHNLKSKWAIAKSTEVDKNDRDVLIIRTLLKCSPNEAIDIHRNKLMDMDKLEDIYIRLHEPEKIKFRKRK